MTMQTDLPTGASPNHSFDQDYEDIDEGKDLDHSVPLTVNPRYHEQGPTAAGGGGGGATNSQPIYTIPTQSLDDVQYSEIGAPGSNPMIPEKQNTASFQMHGYGKLDHSRPRQTYNPKRDSPLLSGYRKLDHMQASPSRATTLPHGTNAPGYANIAIPNSESNHHVRSVSLPSSEYSNLNPNSISQPTTPTADTPTRVRKYSNFEIIEACDEENPEMHAPISRPASEDYHMLADATIDRSDPIPSIRGEYEFLPVCMCEDDDDMSLKSSDSLRFQVAQEMERMIAAKGMNSIGRELIEEKMSINSHSSADFTGPFFFPHMANFSGQALESERHVYRALDVSTMEPQKGYAMVNLKEE